MSTALKTTTRSGLARFFAAPLVAALALLAGCETSGVNGKVIEGSSSIITMADAKDARMEGPGIEGVEVELRKVREGMSETIVQKVVTDSEGRFHITFKDRLTGETLVLTARRPGFLAAKGSVSLSSPGKQSLVVLKMMSK